MEHNSSICSLPANAMRRLSALTLAALAVAGWSLVSCQGLGQASGFPQEKLSAGWTVHRDPMGFSLNLPAGWNAVADKSSGRINLSGLQSEQIVIWPAWAPQGLDLPTAQVTMEVSQIAAQTQEHISDSIMSSYWNKVNSNQETMRKVENAILGTADVVDPATGDQKRIENSSNYCWIENRGVIAGTNTDSVPGLDFRRLTQLP
jgi:hypothetical protein